MSRILVAGGLLIALLVPPSAHAARRPQCFWYVIEANDDARTIVEEEIHKLVSQLEEFKKLPGKRALIAVVEGYPGESLMPLIAVRDVLRHLVADLETLKAIASAFPVPRSFLDHRGIWSSSQLQAIQEGRLVSPPKTFENAEALVNQMIEDSIAFMNDPNQAGLFMWQLYLPELFYTYSNQYEQRGPIAVLMGRLPTPDHVKLLWEQRNRFFTQPGKNPLLPGMLGNFSEVQELQIARALEDSGKFTTKQAEKVVTSSFFRWRYPILRRNYLDNQKMMMAVDLVLIQSVLGAYEEGVAKGSEMAANFSDIPIGAPALEGLGGVPQGRAVREFMGRTHIQQAVTFLQGSGLMLNPHRFVSDYLGDGLFDGPRWQEASKAQEIAVEVADHLALFSTTLNLINPSAHDLSALNQADIIEMHEEGIPGFAFPIRPAVSTAADQAEKQVAELLQHPLVGGRFKTLLREYMYYRWRLRIPHHYRFPEFVTSLRRLAKLE